MTRSTSSIRVYFFNRIEYLVISIVLPISWVFFEKYFDRISKKNSFLPPVKDKFDTATIYIHDPNTKIPIRHTLLPFKSAKAWAKSTLNINHVKITSDLSNIESDVLIITGDWVNRTKPHLKFFYPAFKLARKIKKQKVPVWFLAGDTYNLHLTISASILVARCGGAIILQQNTRREALVFGIPFPSGPHLWLLNPGNVSLFKSDLKWESRKPIILFAATGDDKRRQYLEQTKDHLAELGWEVVPGNHQFDWVTYRAVNQNARINIVLSLRQSAVDKRLRFLRSRASEFMVSSRVFEGFCSGSLVITNSNPVLSEFGFESGVHYLDIDVIQNSSFLLPNNKSLGEIANAGNDLFYLLVHNRV